MRRQKTNRPNRSLAPAGVVFLALLALASFGAPLRAQNQTVAVGNPAQAEAKIVFYYDANPEIVARCGEFQQADIFIDGARAHQIGVWHVWQTEIAPGVHAIGADTSKGKGASGTFAAGQTYYYGLIGHPKFGISFLIPLCADYQIKVGEMKPKSKEYKKATALVGKPRTDETMWTPPPQTVEIKLVDGRNGRHMGRSSVDVWVGHERKPAMILATDERGVARLRLTRTDSEVNVSDCKGMFTDLKHIRSKKEEEEFNRKFKDCGGSGAVVSDPVVKYAGSISINLPLSLLEDMAYVPCWVDARKDKYSWPPMTKFSMKEVLEHGVVTVNRCGKATESPKPGLLVLFLRPPASREQWRQIWNY